MWTSFGARCRSLTAMLALSAAAATGQAVASPTKTILGLPTPMAPYAAYMVYGRQLGFFAEEGIDLDFVSLQGATVLIPQVANKSVTIGLTTPDVPVIALDKGSPYPVKFVYNLFTRQLFEFVVPENSPLKTPADLKGKKLGVGALTWGSLSIARAILAEAGITWMKDVQVIPVGVGPAAWRRLANGEVDAMYMFAHQNELMQLSGTPIRRLKSPEKFDSLFGNGFLVHEDTIRTNPKLVEGFGRAMAKSHLACQFAADSCLRSYWTFDPSSKPAPEKEAGWLRTYRQLLKVDSSFVTANQKAGRVGEFDPSGWKAITSVMKAGEQIARTDLDLRKVYSNRFVEAFNRFDPEQVRKRTQGK